MTWISIQFSNYRKESYVFTKITSLWFFNPARQVVRVQSAVRPRGSKLMKVKSVSTRDLCDERLQPSQARPTAAGELVPWRSLAPGHLDATPSWTPNSRRRAPDPGRRTSRQRRGEQAAVPPPSGPAEERHARAADPYRAASGESVKGPRRSRVGPPNKRAMWQPGNRINRARATGQPSAGGGFGTRNHASKWNWNRWARTIGLCSG